MDLNNNNPINKVKEEIKNAKDVITNTNDKSIADKVKSLATPKNDSQNINNNSKNNEKENVISNNISNTGNGDKYNESSSNENVANTSNSSNNSSSVVSNLTDELPSDIEILDDLSKACTLAMSNISFLATRAGKKIKNELVSIYSGYTDILSSVNKNFGTFGEIPSNVSPNLKMMGLFSINLNTKVDRSASHIAEIMIQGLNMGIIKCQKLINSSSATAKQETLNLVQQFLDFQEQSIQRLKAYL